MATTVLTTWVRTFQSANPDLYDYVVTSLGDDADDFDLDGLADDFLDAVNDNLPAGLWLVSNGELIGPAGDDSALAAEKLREAVEDVDFWTIAQAYCRTAADA